MPKATSLPPLDLEAEAAVLGALLIDQDAILKVKPILEPADFFSKQHQAVYAAILYLREEDMPIDMVTLGKVLEGKVRDSELTGLIATTPTSIHAEYYAWLVRKARVQRELIDLATGLTKDAYAANGDLPEITAGLRAGLSHIERLMLCGADGLGLRASLDYYLDLLERREADKDKPKLEFPWSDLANLMPYLDAGTLVSILAEPGAGKTAFMENVAEDWAKVGWRVAFFHLELSTQMMLDRRMQRHSGVPIKRLQLGGQLDGPEYEKILNASNGMLRWPGHIQYIHCPGWSMGKIVATAQKLHDADGLDVVIVDYFNKVKMVDRNGMNSAQLRGQDIEDFKTALEVNGWVGLMAAQFDKASKSQRRKTLADARDTGELEDKSNVGLVIERPRDDDNQRSDVATVQVVKCNAGQEGSIQMVFRGEKLAFYPIAYK